MSIFLCFVCCSEDRMSPLMKMEEFFVFYDRKMEMEQHEIKEQESGYDFELLSDAELVNLEV